MAQGTNSVRESGRGDPEIERARFFLEHPDVRTASLGAQITFLQGKGLTKRQIATALRLAQGQDPRYGAVADDLDSGRVEVWQVVSGHWKAAPQPVSMAARVGAFVGGFAVSILAAFGIKYMWDWSFRSKKASEELEGRKAHLEDGLIEVNKELAKVKTILKSQSESLSQGLFSISNSLETLEKSAQYRDVSIPESVESLAAAASMATESGVLVECIVGEQHMQEAISKLVSSSDVDASRQAANLLVLYLAKIIRMPSDVNSRQVHMSNSSFRERIIPAEGALDLLRSVGYVQLIGQPVLQWFPKGQTEVVPDESDLHFRLVRIACEELQQVSGICPAVQSSKYLAILLARFLPFLSMVVEMSSSIWESPVFEGILLSPFNPTDHPPASDATLCIDLFVDVLKASVRCAAREGGCSFDDKLVEATHIVGQVLLQALGLVHELRKADTHEKLSKFLTTFCRRIQKLIPGDMLAVPCGWVKPEEAPREHSIFLLLIRRPDSFSVVLSNRSEDDGLTAYHPQNARSHPKIKYMCSLRFDDIPQDRIADEGFWLLAFQLLKFPSDMNHSGFFYESLMSFLVNGNIVDAITKKASSSDSRCEYKTAQKSRFGIVPCLKECCRYLLRVAGLSTTQVKYVMHQLRRELVLRSVQSLRRLSRDRHAVLRSSGLRRLHWSGAALARSCIKQQNAGRLFPSELADTTSLVDSLTQELQKYKDSLPLYSTDIIEATANLVAHKLPMFDAVVANTGQGTLDVIESIRMKSLPIRDAMEAGDTRESCGTAEIRQSISRDYRGDLSADLDFTLLDRIEFVSMESIFEALRETSSLIECIEKSIPADISGLLHIRSLVEHLFLDVIPLPPPGCEISALHLGLRSTDRPAAYDVTAKVWETPIESKKQQLALLSDLCLIAESYSLSCLGLPGGSPMSERQSMNEYCLTMGCIASIGITIFRKEPSKELASCPRVMLGHNKHKAVYACPYASSTLQHIVDISATFLLYSPRMLRARLHAIHFFAVEEHLSKESGAILGANYDGNGIYVLSSSDKIFEFLDGVCNLQGYDFGFTDVHESETLNKSKAADRRFHNMSRALLDVNSDLHSMYPELSRVQTIMCLWTTSLDRNSHKQGQVAAISQRIDLANHRWRTATFRPWSNHSRIAFKIVSLDEQIVKYRIELWDTIDAWILETCDNKYEWEGVLRPETYVSHDTLPITESLLVALDSKDLPNIDSRLSKGETEQLLGFMTAPYLRLPLLLAFFSSRGRSRLLTNATLQQILEASLFIGGAWKNPYHAPPAYVGDIPLPPHHAQETDFTYDQSLLYNEIVNSPQAIIEPLIQMCREAFNSTRTWDVPNEEYSRYFIFLTRILVYVESFVACLLTNSMSDWVCLPTSISNSVRDDGLREQRIRHEFLSEHQLKQYLQRIRYVCDREFGPMLIRWREQCIERSQLEDAAEWSACICLLHLNATIESAPNEQQPQTQIIQLLGCSMFILHSPKLLLRNRNAFVPGMYLDTIRSFTQQRFDIIRWINDKDVKTRGETDGIIDDVFVISHGETVSSRNSLLDQRVKNVDRHHWQRVIDDSSNSTYKFTMERGWITISIQLCCCIVRDYNYELIKLPRDIIDNCHQLDNCMSFEYGWIIESSMIYTKYRIHNSNIYITSIDQQLCMKHGIQLVALALPRKVSSSSCVDAEYHFEGSIYKRNVLEHLECNTMESHESYYGHAIVAFFERYLGQDWNRIVTSHMNLYFPSTLTMRDDKNMNELESYPTSMRLLAVRTSNTGNLHDRSLYSEVIMTRHCDTIHMCINEFVTDALEMYRIQAFSSHPMRSAAYQGTYRDALDSIIESFNSWIQCRPSNHNHHGNNMNSTNGFVLVSRMCENGMEEILISNRALVGLLPNALIERAMYWRQSMNHDCVHVVGYQHNNVIDDAYEMRITKEAHCGDDCGLFGEWHAMYRQLQSLTPQSIDTLRNRQCRNVKSILDKDEPYRKMYCNRQNLQQLVIDDPINDLINDDNDLINYSTITSLFKCKNQRILLNLLHPPIRLSELCRVLTCATPLTQCAAWSESISDPFIDSIECFMLNVDFHPRTLNKKCIEHTTLQQQLLLPSYRLYCSQYPDYYISTSTINQQIAYDFQHKLVLKHETTSRIALLIGITNSIGSILVPLHESSTTMMMMHVPSQIILIIALLMESNRYIQAFNMIQRHLHHTLIIDDDFSLLKAALDIMKRTSNDYAPDVIACRLHVHIRYNFNDESLQWPWQLIEQYEAYLKRLSYVSITCKLSIDDELYIIKQCQSIDNNHRIRMMIIIENRRLYISALAASKHHNHHNVVNEAIKQPFECKQYAMSSKQRMYIRSSSIIMHNTEEEYDDGRIMYKRLYDKPMIHGEECIEFVMNLLTYPRNALRCIDVFIVIYELLYGSLQLRINHHNNGVDNSQCIGRILSSLYFNDNHKHVHHHQNEVSLDSHKRISLDHMICILHQLKCAYPHQHSKFPNIVNAANQNDNRYEFISTLQQMLHLHDEQYEYEHNVKEMDYIWILYEPIDDDDDDDENIIISSSSSYILYANQHELSISFSSSSYQRIIDACNNECSESSDLRTLLSSPLHIYTQTLSHGIPSSILHTPTEQQQHSEKHHMNHVETMSFSSFDDVSSLSSSSSSLSIEHESKPNHIMNDGVEDRIIESSCDRLVDLIVSLNRRYQCDRIVMMHCIDDCIRLSNRINNSNNNDNDDEDVRENVMRCKHICGLAHHITFPVIVASLVSTQCHHDLRLLNPLIECTNDIVASAICAMLYCNRLCQINRIIQRILQALECTYRRSDADDEDGGGDISYEISSARRNKCIDDCTNQLIYQLNIKRTYVQQCKDDMVYDPRYFVYEFITESIITQHQWDMSNLIMNKLINNNENDSDGDSEFSHTLHVDSISNMTSIQLALMILGCDRKQCLIVVPQSMISLFSYSLHHVFALFPLPIQSYYIHTLTSSSSSHIQHHHYTVTPGCIVVASIQTLHKAQLYKRRRQSQLTSHHHCSGYSLDRIINSLSMNACALVLDARCVIRDAQLYGVSMGIDQRERIGVIDSNQSTYIFFLLSAIVIIPEQQQQSMDSLSIMKFPSTYTQAFIHGRKRIQSVLQRGVDMGAVIVQPHLRLCNQPKSSSMPFYKTYLLPALREWTLLWIQVKRCDISLSHAKAFLEKHDNDDAVDDEKHSVDPFIVWCHDWIEYLIPWMLHLEIGVDYGLPQQSSSSSTATQWWMASCYAACPSPLSMRSKRTRYAIPQIEVGLTLLSYLNQGLRQCDVQRLIIDMKAQANYEILAADGYIQQNSSWLFKQWASSEMQNGNESSTATTTITETHQQGHIIPWNIDAVDPYSIDLWNALRYHRNAIERYCFNHVLPSLQLHSKRIITMDGAPLLNELCMNSVALFHPSFPCYDPLDNRRDPCIVHDELNVLLRGGDNVVDCNTPHVPVENALKYIDSRALCAIWNHDVIVSIQQCQDDDEDGESIIQTIASPMQGELLCYHAFIDLGGFLSHLQSNQIAHRFLKSFTNRKRYSHIVYFDPIQHHPRIIRRQLHGGVQSDSCSYSQCTLSHSEFVYCDRVHGNILSTLQRTESSSSLRNMNVAITISDTNTLEEFQSVVEPLIGGGGGGNQVRIHLFVRNSFHMLMIQPLNPQYKIFDMNNNQSFAQVSIDDCKRFMLLCSQQERLQRLLNRANHLVRWQWMQLFHNNDAEDDSNNHMKHVQLEAMAPLRRSICGAASPHFAFILEQDADCIEKAISTLSVDAAKDMNQKMSISLVLQKIRPWIDLQRKIEAMDASLSWISYSSVSLCDQEPTAATLPKIDQASWAQDDLQIEPTLAAHLQNAPTIRGKWHISALMKDPKSLYTYDWCCSVGSIKLQDCMSMDSVYQYPQRSTLLASREYMYPNSCDVPIRTGLGGSRLKPLTIILEWIPPSVDAASIDAAALSIVDETIQPKSKMLPSRLDAHLVAISLAEAQAIRYAIHALPTLDNTVSCALRFAVNGALLDCTIAYCTIKDRCIAYLPNDGDSPLLLSCIQLHFGINLFFSYATAREMAQQFNAIHGDNDDNEHMTTLVHRQAFNYVRASQSLYRDRLHRESLFRQSQIRDCICLEHNENEQSPIGLLLRSIDARGGHDELMRLLGCSAPNGSVDYVPCDSWWISIMSMCQGQGVSPHYIWDALPRISQANNYDKTTTIDIANNIINGCSIQTILQTLKLPSEIIRSEREYIEKQIACVLEQQRIDLERQKEREIEQAIRCKLLAEDEAAKQRLDELHRLEAEAASAHMKIEQWNKMKDQIEFAKSNMEEEYRIKQQAIERQVLEQQRRYEDSEQLRRSQAHQAQEREIKFVTTIEEQKRENAHMEAEIRERERATDQKLLEETQKLELAMHQIAERRQKVTLEEQRAQRLLEVSEMEQRRIDKARETFQKEAKMRALEMSDESRQRREHLQKLINEAVSRAKDAANKETEAKLAIRELDHMMEVNSKIHSDLSQTKRIIEAKERELNSIRAANEEQKRREIIEEDKRQMEIRIHEEKKEARTREKALVEAEAILRMERDIESWISDLDRRRTREAYMKSRLRWEVHYDLEQAKLERKHRQREEEIALKHELNVQPSISDRDRWLAEEKERIKTEIEERTRKWKVSNEKNSINQNLIASAKAAEIRSSIHRDDTLDQLISQGKLVMLQLDNVTRNFQVQEAPRLTDSTSIAQSLLLQQITAVENAISKLITKQETSMDGSITSMDEILVMERYHEMKDVLAAKHAELLLQLRNEIIEQEKSIIAQGIQWRKERNAFDEKRTIVSSTRHQILERTNDLQRSTAFVANQTQHLRESASVEADKLATDFKNKVEQIGESYI